MNNVKKHAAVVKTGPMPVEIAIRSLHEALRTEYGHNFSYIVCGRGEVIGLKTMNDGLRTPEGEEVCVYVGA